MKFEIYSRRTLRGKRWFFRIRAKNHKILAQSEGYYNRDDAVDTCIVIMEQAHTAKIVGR